MGVSVMWVSVRVKIGNKEPFFGVGPRNLLQEIDACQSIKGAAQKMKLSYSKALKILNSIEQELGFAVITSSRGGNEHGSTLLTEKGRELIDFYCRMEKEIDAKTQAYFNKNYPFAK